MSRRAPVVDARLGRAVRDALAYLRCGLTADDRRVLEAVEDDADNVARGIPLIRPRATTSSVTRSAKLRRHPRRPVRSVGATIGARRGSRFLDEPPDGAARPRGRDHG